MQPLYKDSIILFAQEVLGMPVHDGQKEWLRESNKVINILRPANQWGKTLIVAITHLYECCFKPGLFGMTQDSETWKEVRYETVNVGKTYEIARGVFETAMDIVEGRFLLPSGKTNESTLKGWAITKSYDQANRPPEIHFWNGSRILIRSYDDLGSAFKRKKLAYISSDECGDIPELKLFLTGTMLPRISFYKGKVDLIGTPQPEGIEYEELSIEAQKKMEKEKEGGEESDMYFRTGPIYENPFLDKKYIEKIEAVADPELRRQIIYGEYVDWGDHFFSFDEVANMFDTKMEYDPETGFSEYPDAKGNYIFSVDLAASHDETAATCIRYGIEIKGLGGDVIELPHRIVFHKAFRGRKYPLHMQYELIKSWFNSFKNVAPSTRFVFDAHSLGGKNAAEAFSDLKGVPFPPSGMAPVKAKAEAMGMMKEVFSRGRKVKYSQEADKMIDTEERWGGIKASPKLKELRRQFEVYKMDDKYLKQDRLISVVQAVHYIERRRPRLSHNRAVKFNYLGGTVRRNY
jgi:hypothetical protein